MKLLTVLFILSFGLLSCMPSGDEIPDNIEEQKALLKIKKAELKEIETTIARLEASIEEVEPTKERPKKLVTVMQPNVGEFKRFIEIQASIESEDLVAVSAEMGGRLLNVTAKEGQYVKRGQLLATVDIESLKKQKEEIETALDLAKITYERQKRLWDQNIGSEIQYLQAKNNKERLEKSLETLDVQMSKSNVYAPISGVVDREILKQGELAAPGAPIMQLLNLSRVKVVADVPENYLGSVKRGETVRIRIPALKKELRSKVSLIGRTIDPSNRTFKVEVALPNPGNTIKPNLLASMFINDLTIEEAIVIPQELVQQEIGGKDYVYVVGDTDEGKAAKKVYVKTGETNDGDIVIKEGLQGNETIIKDGARGLTAGELIKFEN